MKINQMTLLVFLCMLTLIGGTGPLFSDDSNTDLSMVIGDLQSVPVNKLQRVSVTNPEIADVADAQADKVMILAKKSGQSSVFLWDQEGKHIVSVHVVTEDLKQTKDRIAHLLEEAEIKNVKLEPNMAEGKVVLTGPVPKAKKNLFDKILSSYSDQVLNLTKEEQNQELIQIDMQITELSSTLDKNLGFDWAGGNVGSSLSLNYNENPTANGVPAVGGGSKNWFKFAQFNRTTAIVNTVNLMLKEGKARDLSRPRIMVLNGKEATINVGGEVPISSVTTSGSNQQQTENTTFKQYGVTLTVTPTIKDGKIDIVMNVQVTDVDKTFVLPATKTNDIAYKTRSTQTQLLLDDRQQVVFAGLIRYNDSEQTKSVPFLGKIPVIGLLFRDKFKQAPDEGKELVISLTPTIYRAKDYAEEQLKLPSKEMTNNIKDIETKNNVEYEKIPVAPVPTAPAAPAAAVPASPKAEVFGGSNMEYVRSVQTKVSQNISYPADAIKNSWDGTVKLKLHILKDGSLADVSVVESSGHDVFDQDALNAAKVAAPFDAFNQQMKLEYLNVTLPIVYNQGNKTNNSQTVVATY